MCLNVKRYTKLSQQIRDRGYDSEKWLVLTLFYEFCSNSMVYWRCLIACSFITFSIFGCSGGVNSSTANTQEVVKRLNVSQLFTEAEDSQKAEQLFLQGNSLFDARRYQDAIAIYEEAITAKPDSADIWINRGNALASLQKYKDALSSYDKAIALQPEKDEAWYNRGNVLMTLQNYPDAVAAYNKAIALAPNQAAAWINRGISLSKLQRYEEALKSYERAIAINPNKAEAYYNQACTYALLGKVELATKNLQKAIKFDAMKYQQLAKTDADFNQIRHQQEFQELIQ